MKLPLTILLVFYSIHSFAQIKEFKPSTADSVLKEQTSGIIKLKEILKDSIKTSQSDTLKNSIFEQVNKLEDVFIMSKSKYDAVSLGIIEKEVKPLTQYERQLYTAGDFKPIHLLSLLGGSLQVDPIINAISGRTKRLKKYIKVEKKENNILFLENHYQEFMLNNLNIPKELLGRFLNYLIENDTLQDLINRKDNGALYFFIGDEWFKFKEFQEDILPLLLKEASETEE
ncbi:hypothetical protein [Aequorivita xiaoshiensis]|uniref:DUF4476 domain-containing protein n=1 Tax=Aequorivita xiaoshiensis TaxID=2874476 RepID=A0A9X1U583_9FLAO|nr:hypothetical protein [Aequorivita xiaoshiensis]MCG2430303.1 hypothetical protein [Aequorivita xiaoshiensis]